MSDREFTERYCDDLENIEFAIVTFYREHPELADSNVDRVLDLLARVYAAETNQRKAPPIKLSALDQPLFDRIRTVCEWRLGRGTAPSKPRGKAEFQPKVSEEMTACLKRVRSSVKLWTKELGRQGYLNWIATFFE
jgi:hypothetical protein